jgi:aspartyl-tRNA(Asn)/glutamyl-tRNA(Gln) amidotransferase subunit A
VTLKGLTRTQNLPTFLGTRAAVEEEAAEEAAFVPRLRAAGAIVLGKTTVSEFGWAAVSRSPATGITSNPWKHGYNAGASSAGAAAAAAAGFGPLHQGSDGTGSIRLPAHFSGVFGHKPSFGRVPYNPVRVDDLTAHAGPITRTVADAALMLEVMAGPHRLDHTTLEAPPAAYASRLHEGVEGRRITFSPDLGAHVEQVETPWGARGPELIRFFWSAHLASLAPLLPEWEAEMDPGLVACIRASEDVVVTHYQEMRVRKMAYVAAIHSFFEDWDLLLTPSASVAAFPADRLMPQHWPDHPWDWLSWAEFSYPFNMAWNPAASVPCGFTQDGLPVGLQIVGRRFDDLGVLQAAAAFEAVQPWHDKHPPL